MSPLTRIRDDFTSNVHVYEPHSVGLPPLKTYVRELWRRREFAVEMSRTNLRAQHYDKGFGMLWLVLNPLLLGLTYTLLVFIIRGGSRDDGPQFLAHLLGALFAYHFFNQSVMTGANSVMKGGRLLLNSSFPRALLPLSAVITGFMKFLPTLVVYAIVHAVVGVETNANLLWTLPVLVILTVFSTGAAMLFATVQVYFRDMTSFLPYILRITLYLTPILWTVEELQSRGNWARRIIRINPLYDIVGSWSLALEGKRPPVSMLLIGTGWALFAFVVGALFFVSREREFAVRL